MTRERSVTYGPRPGNSLPTHLPKTWLEQPSPCLPAIASPGNQNPIKSAHTKSQTHKNTLLQRVVRADFWAYSVQRSQCFQSQTSGLHAGVFPVFLYYSLGCLKKRIPPKRIGDVPKVLKFNRSFLKLSRFMCGVAAGCRRSLCRRQYSLGGGGGSGGRGSRHEG